MEVTFDIDIDGFREKYHARDDGTDEKHHQKNSAANIPNAFQ